MDAEKPKPQKVVIDISHAWTEEDKKRNPEQWAEIEKKNSGEKKEYPKKFSAAREYIGNMLNFFKNRPEKDTDSEESANYWEETLADLDCGNERTVMENLEDNASREHYVTKKKELVLWRKAIFEISKETNITDRLLSPDDVGKGLYEEFTQRQSEMDKALDENPKGYNNEDRRDYGKEVLKWQDVANEVSYGNFENACILLEKAIEDKVDFINDARSAIEIAAKQKDPNMQTINGYREKITADSKKLETYRRMRDSLYAIEFSK